MPDPAEVTDEMVEAGAAEFRRITKGDGVLTPQETRMDIHEMATHHILTAARQHDPLVAEVVRLREENERLTGAAQAAVDEWQSNDDLWPDHRIRRMGEPMRLLSMRLRSAALSDSHKGEEG